MTKEDYYKKYENDLKTASPRWSQWLAELIQLMEDVEEEILKAELESAIHKDIIKKLKRIKNYYKKGGVNNTPGDMAKKEGKS